MSVSDEIRNAGAGFQSGHMTRPQPEQTQTGVPGNAEQIVAFEHSEEKTILRAVGLGTNLRHIECADAQEQRAGASQS